MEIASHREYKGVKIAVRKRDGFIDATSMCKVGGKKFSHWKDTDIVRRLIQALKTELNQEVLDVKKGNSSGSWIHPRLATCLASWIDPLFALKVSGWIEEWRLVGKNDERYIQALEEVKSSPTAQLERNIQERLHAELGGVIEKKTPVGYIDLITDDQIIEIKDICNWKQGMGQLLSYAKFHSSQRKRLHLFNSEGYEAKEAIEYVCADYDIIVTYE